MVNTGVTAATSGINFLLGFFVLAAARRELGDVGLGVWSLALGLLAMSALVDFGLGSALGILVARHAGGGDRARLNDTLNAYLATAFPLAIIVAVAGAFSSPWLARHLVGDPAWNAQASSLFALMFLALAMQMAGSLIGGVLVGYQMLATFRAWHVFWQMVKSLGTLWLLSHQTNLTMLGWWMVLGSAGFIATAWGVWMRRVPLRLTLSRPSPAAICELWHVAVPLQLNRLASSILGQVDKFVLALLVGAAAAGWYELAARLAGALLFLPGFMLAALAPLISALAGGQARERAMGLMWLSSRYVGLMVFPMAGFIFLYGDSLLHWWLGRSDAQVLMACRVLLGVFLLLSLQQPFVDSLLGMGKHRLVLRFAVVVILANIPASTLLVSVYGFAGAYWATFLVVLAASAIFFRAVSVELDIPLSRWAREWFRPMSAAGLTMVAMSFTPVRPLSLGQVIVCLGLGACCYALFALALGAFTREDVRRLRGAWAQR